MASRGEPREDADHRANLLGAFAVAIVDRLRHETEAAIGHSGASAAALTVIAQYPGSTIEELRQAIGLSHPAAVRVVDRLEERRLVRRRLVVHGPAVALTATPAGRRTARRLLDLRRRVLAEAMPELSAQEAVALSAVLEQGLERLAADASRSPTICGLCDAGPCRGGDWPVARAQQALNFPTSEPSRLDP